MKKLVCLLTACLLALCCSLPALAADAPAIALPVSLEDFQRNYEAVIAFVMPDATVTWQERTDDRGSVYAALINDAFLSLLVVPEGDNVAQLAAILQTPLSDKAMMTFLSMIGYGGAALLLEEGTDAQTACNEFTTALHAAFSAYLEGQPVSDVCGLPARISLSPLDAEASAWQFYCLLDLSAQSAP